MRLWFSRRPRDAEASSHDKAMVALQALRRTKVQLDRYEADPNDGYRKPYNSVAYPGWTPLDR